MFFRLLLLFTIVPLIELALLIKIGDEIGFVPTIAIVLITGALGAALARKQGLDTLSKFRQQTATGLPEAGLIGDGIMILIAGALLITPGVLTDVLGFSLLVPAFRNTLKNVVSGWVVVKTASKFQSFQYNQGGDPVGGGGPFRDQPRPPDDNVIDVEFTRHPDSGGNGETSDKLEDDRPS